MHMRLKDTETGYGWISILLHWLTAILIITLWFIGDSIHTGDTADYLRLKQLHVSIAASFYILLVARILWRLHCSHPGPLPGQGRIFFTIGKWTHYFLLLLLTVMLISGPFTVWLGGEDIHIFSLLIIPSPITKDITLQGVFALIHGTSSNLLAILVVLHILGTFKHIIFNRDGTFDKIMIAAKDTGTKRVIPDRKFDE